MNLRILCAISAQRGAHLLEHLRTRRGGIAQVRMVEDTMQSLVREIDRTMPDVVLYDPLVDKGALIAECSIGGPSVPAVICVSDDPSYALMAFQLGAVHYLSYDAPVHELDCALERSRILIAPHDASMLLHERPALFAPSHDVIALPVLSGIELRDRRTIVRIQGEGNYTRVIFVNDPPIILSRTIRDYAPVLEHSGLLRVHRSHLVNIVHVRRILRGKTPRLLMCNGDEVDVSTTYRDKLFAAVRIVERRAS